MKAKQVYQEMVRGKDSQWELQAVNSLESTMMGCKNFSFYLTDRNEVRREANSEAIIQAVNGTWLKGLDPNKMEDIVKALIEAKEIIKSFHDVSYESKELKKKLWNAYNKGSEMKAINQVLESCKL